MPNEKDFEDLLVKYPELIEDGLRLTGRQKMVHGRRLDLLFEDRSKRSLVIELKWGPIKDQHVGQVMAYAGSLISAESPDLRVMLIGTRVPPSFRLALDHHGIAWKEIAPPEIQVFLREKQDLKLLAAFSDDVNGSAGTPGVGEVVRRSTSISARSIADGTPALWVPLGSIELQRAFAAFNGGRSEIYYGTSGPIGAAQSLPISNVYFKVKARPEVVAKAEFIEVTTENVPSNRISIEASHVNYKFYYGFRNLIMLQHPIPLSSLRRYSKGTPVLYTAQSPCIIEEISD